MKIRRIPNPTTQSTAMKTGKNSKRLKVLYIKFLKLTEIRQHHVHELNSLQIEKSSLLLKIQDLEEKLLETQLQLERVTDEKLTNMLSIQKCPTNKTGLGYVASTSDSPQSPSLHPPAWIREKVSLEEKVRLMQKSLRSLLPKEALPYATIVV
jgi:hypothetical protein